MKTRKIFWICISVFTMIIIGIVLFMNVLSFERLFPLECDVSEEWLRGKTDFLVVKDFFDRYPDSKFENLGNMKNMPKFCQYAFVSENDGKTRQMIISVDKNLQLMKISADP
ncbi:MAG: hypothetical protein J4F36_11410 [Nitrosopumilaceae archaeon]|nr:hypothetical protein [Nitrosopumilaceae archaeon]